MIKIFEDEENQQEKSGPKDPALFSLNLDPVSSVEDTAESPIPVESVREAPVKTAPVSPSPWETIGETPTITAPEPLDEPEIPAASPPAIPADIPDISPEAAEPAGFIEDTPSEPELFVKVPYQPDTSDETIRNSGLAWSAGIIFFGSVIFMMFLGWGFDLLFGSSPYGLVGGIVFGSLIGFIQFFRISAQIFKK